MPKQEICIHIEVCQHRIEDVDAGESCKMAKVCRYFQAEVIRTHDHEVLRKHGPKKRPYHRKEKIDNKEFASEEGPTKKEFLKARQKLFRAKREGKPVDNQLAAIKALKGIPYKSLSIGQRQQIVDMAKKA